MATGVDAGGYAQHDAGALAHLACDLRDARRLVRLVDDDFGKALFDGERDLLIGFVVAVQHQPATGYTGCERDAHLAHGTGVDEHARAGDDAADLLAEERFAGEAHMGDGVVEGAGRGADESFGALTHFVGVDEVQRRAELAEQAFRGAPMEGDFAVFVDGAGFRPDRGDCHT